MDTHMDGQAMPSIDEVPLFDETDYSRWRVEIKEYLKSKGAGIFRPIASKNISKFTTQRRVRKKHEVALKIRFNGLSDTVKASMGLCTSSKDLWMKLEKVYQIKRQDKEGIPIKDEKED
jgi:hypothetical protein